jgi:hypothetical protein
LRFNDSLCLTISDLKGATINGVLSVSGEASVVSALNDPVLTVKSVTTTTYSNAVITAASNTDNATTAHLLFKVVRGGAWVSERLATLLFYLARPCLNERRFFF